MTFPIVLGRALLALAVLLAATRQITADQGPSLPVYGGPGGGRIRVEVQGDVSAWHHPGVYWLPQGTPLVELLKRADPVHAIVEGNEEGAWAVNVKRGDQYPEKFSLYRFQRGQIKVTFCLKDGDIVGLWEATE
jgi:hypothetical protein